MKHKRTCNFSFVDKFTQKTMAMAAAAAASVFLPAFLSCASPSSASPPFLHCSRPLLSPRLCFLGFKLPLQHHHHSPLPLAARAMSGSSGSQQHLKENISSNPVVVYSKSYCPYCMRVKDLFKELGVKPFVIELDELSDGNEVQTALQKLTGQYTVPNVFIGGKHIGGCDDTVALHQRGKLIPLLKESGLNVS